MVLRWEQRNDGLAVDQAEQGNFWAIEEGLEQDRVSCRVNLVYMFLRGSAVVGDNDALAAGEAIIFDHEVRAETVEGGLNVGVGSPRHQLLRASGANASSIHDVLGKGLGALNLRGLLGGAEDGDAVGAQLICDAGNQRHLGANDDELGVNFLRQLQHLCWVINLGVLRMHRGQGSEVR